MRHQQMMADLSQSFRRLTLSNAVYTASSVAGSLWNAVSHHRWPVMRPINSVPLPLRSHHSGVRDSKNARAAIKQVSAVGRWIARLNRSEAYVSNRATEMARYLATTSSLSIPKLLHCVESEASGKSLILVVSKEVFCG